MRFTVEFNPEFYLDLVHAMDWYEKQQSGLGKTFYLAVKKQSHDLQSSAMRYALRYNNIR